MEVGVKIIAENVLTGVRRHTKSCYVTYVALDEQGVPTQVPPIVPETPDEKRRYDRASKRLPLGSWIGDSTRAPVSRVVAVFGGGGAKSLAHAGAWKALLEAGLRPCHIVGTSMGAVISAALAAGSSYERLVEIALSLERKDFAASTPGRSRRVYSPATS